MWQGIAGVTEADTAGTDLSDDDLTSLLDPRTEDGRGIKSELVLYDVPKNPYDIKVEFRDRALGGLFNDNERDLLIHRGSGLHQVLLDASGIRSRGLGELQHGSPSRRKRVPGLHYGHRFQEALRHAAVLSEARGISQQEMRKEPLRLSLGLLASGPMGRTNRDRHLSRFGGIPWTGPGRNGNRIIRTPITNLVAARMLAMGINPKSLPFRAKFV
jgi:hypothetical protein